MSPFAQAIALSFLTLSSAAVCDSAGICPADEETNFMQVNRLYKNGKERSRHLKGAAVEDDPEAMMQMKEHLKSMTGEDPVGVAVENPEAAAVENPEAAAVENEEAAKRAREARMQDIRQLAYNAVHDPVRKLEHQPVKAAACQPAQPGQTKFVKPRGDGFHFLFNPSLMELYFGQICGGAMGTRLTAAIAAMPEGEREEPLTHEKIWNLLLDTMVFSGVDFEHAYGILGAALELDAFSFPETMVLTQTILLVPVMQLAAPLARALKADEVQRLGRPAPVLVVGMNGACVKGMFFERLEEEQKATLKNPALLESRVKSLMEALASSPFQHIALQATLPGSGAFGGDADVLGPAFATGIEEVVNKHQPKFTKVDLLGDPPWFGTIEGNIIEKVGFGSAEKGTAFGSAPPAGQTRVLIAGFDPVSMAPHGVEYRAISGEGQISGATDLLWRLRDYQHPGTLVEVEVDPVFKPESPAQVPAEAEDPERFYKAWRYVEEPSAEQYILTPNGPVHRNGDCQSGWALSERTQ